MFRAAFLFVFLAVNTLKMNHLAIVLQNSDNESKLIQQILSGKMDVGITLSNRKVGVFSPATITQFIDEDDRHQSHVATQHVQRNMATLSSGEQKKALLNYLISQQPDCLIIDSPFDNLDSAAQAEIKEKLTALSTTVFIIQLLRRSDDLLPFILRVATSHQHHLTFHDSLASLPMRVSLPSKLAIPSSLKSYSETDKTLVKMTNVGVSYGGQPILHAINWTIEAGDFWQLIGPNGSGKTTLLTMITGDNPKAYGQDLLLFGKRKGTGVSIWEIRQLIGYLTPSMMQQFASLQTVEQIIVSGFLDSVGLYRHPSSSQLRLANEWIALLGMHAQRHTPFAKLSQGQQRMVFIARAMVKHPPLLILDEILAGLDDANAALAIALINAIVQETKTAVLLVSHRQELGLLPHKILRLLPSALGSVGIVEE